MAWQTLVVTQYMHWMMTVSFYMYIKVPCPLVNQNVIVNPIVGDLGPWPEGKLHGEHEGIRSQDNTPYHPFRVTGNFKFMEVTLAASLNQVHVDKLLDLISRVAQGMAQFSKHDVTRLYKKQDQTYKVFMHPVWEWALDLLENELLAPHFVWDAQHLYKYSEEGPKHFYDEPWTADCWWDIQVCVNNAVPFGLIIYANKTKLSSFGTAKGYPVVVQCTNLPVGIWNSHAIGGGCIVGWLPIIYSLVKLLEDISQYSQTWYLHTSPYDKVSHWLFLVVLILSADYEEQCMMSLIRGHICKCLCPVCLIPINELHNLAKTYPLCSMDQVQDMLSTYNYSCMAGEEWLKAIGLWPIENVFWHIRNSDPHATLTFDCLHSSHDGVGGRHTLQDVKKILNALGHEAENTINITFLDGNKKHDLVKEIFYACLNVFTKKQTPKGYSLLHILTSYLELDSLICLDVHMESMIEMIEAELLRFNRALKVTHPWKHIGATQNYSTCPNESMHGPLKEAYEWQSNGRAVASQILRVDEHMLAAKLLRTCIDHHMNWSQLQARGLDDDSDLEEPDNGPFEGHIYLGSPCEPTTVQNIKADHSQMDRAFVEFCKKLSTFCNKSLMSYGYQPDPIELHNWEHNSHFYPYLYEYKYLKVNYESLVNWKLTTDHLQCNPMFFGVPRYDCAIVQLTEVDTAFICLICIFSCKVPDICSIDLALAQPFTMKTGAVPHSTAILIPIQSIIWGAILSFLLSHINGDMYLHTKVS
ncbi:hypothetical protein EDC04DRAFT_2869153 [Pisolithus marmoratus]|nr:hypothetical protein EDC04DRAFT_2869153 [Pisolithus marmoratus]